MKRKDKIHKNKLTKWIDCGIVFITDSKERILVFVWYGDTKTYNVTVYDRDWKLLLLGKRRLLFVATNIDIFSRGIV